MKKENEIEGTEADAVVSSERKDEQTSSPGDFAIKKPDRIAMSNDSLSRLDSWKKQVEGARPAVEISRRDLVEWLISKHAESLSSSEVKELSEAHYNELRFLQYAIRELKAAKSQGKTMHLHDMVGTLPTLSRPKERVPRAKKKPHGDTVHQEHEDQESATIIPSEIKITSS